MFLLNHLTKDTWQKKNKGGYANTYEILDPERWWGSVTSALRVSAQNIKHPMN